MLLGLRCEVVGVIVGINILVHPLEFSDYCQTNYVGGVCNLVRLRVGGELGFGNQHIDSTRCVGK
jgi:hypothetical protein